MSSHSCPWRSAVLALALACAAAAPGQQPGDALSRARALAISGKTAEAATILRARIAADPTSADAQFLLGYVLFREQKPRESLAAFTAGARYRRPAADDFTIIASDYVFLRDYSDAAKWFSEVTKEKPSDADAWYLLGRAQYNENRFKSAIASFEQVLKLSPHHVEAENNLGLACQGLDNYAQAIAAYRTAIDWEGSSPDDAQPYLNLGSLMTDQSQVEKALPLLQTAVKLAPANPRAREELGRALESAGHLHEAQQQYQQAISLAPKASGLHYRLARLYMREGQHDLARQQFDICQKLDSTHSSIDTPNPYTPK